MPSTSPANAEISKSRYTDNRTCTYNHLMHLLVSPGCQPFKTPPSDSHRIRPSPSQSAKKEFKKNPPTSPTPHQKSLDHPQKRSLACKQPHDPANAKPPTQRRKVKSNPRPPDRKEKAKKSNAPCCLFVTPPQKQAHDARESPHLGDPAPDPLKPTPSPHSSN